MSEAAKNMPIRSIQEIAAEKRAELAAKLSHPLQLRVREAFTIGGNLGQPVKQLATLDLDTIANKNVRLEVDFDRRIVIVYRDVGNGFVSSGWTPFENVIGANMGAVEKEKAK